MKESKKGFETELMKEYNLRLTVVLYNKIAERAKRNNRSVNQEINTILMRQR